MAGISSKALNSSPINKYKFNSGNELQSGEFFDGSGLELFDAVNRSYDPQLGRFCQVDELADAGWGWSPYNFSKSNPIHRNDPYGLMDSVVNGEHVNTTATLPTVTITGYTNQARRNLYWNLINDVKPFSSIKNDNLREWLYRYDGLQKYKDRLHQMQKEQEITALQIASWMIPAAYFTKLRYLK